MRVSGLVPEREAAEAGGGQQGWTWQRCLLHEGGRQVGSRRHAPSFSFLPGRLSVTLLWASVSLSAKWVGSPLPCTRTGKDQWEDSVQRGSDAQHQSSASNVQRARFTGFSFGLVGAPRGECMRAC